MSTYEILINAKYTTNGGCVGRTSTAIVVMMQDKRPLWKNNIMRTHHFNVAMSLTTFMTRVQPMTHKTETVEGFTLQFQMDFCP